MPTKTKAHIIPKDELVHRVASEAGLSLEATTAALNAFASVSCKAIANGEIVRMVGFLTIEAQEVEPHHFKPIRGNGEMVELPRHKKVRVHVGAVLREAVRESIN